MSEQPAFVGCTLNSGNDLFRCCATCDLLTDPDGVNVDDEDPFAPDCHEAVKYPWVDLCISACSHGIMRVCMDHVIPKVLETVGAPVLYVIPSKFQGFKILPTDRSYTVHDVLTPLPGSTRAPAGLDKKINRLQEVLASDNPPDVVVIPALTASRTPLKWLGFHFSTVLIPAMEATKFGEAFCKRRGFRTGIVYRCPDKGIAKPSWIPCVDSTLLVSINAMRPTYVPDFSDTDSSREPTPKSSPKKPTKNPAPSIPATPPNETNTAVVAITPERFEKIKQAAGMIQEALREAEAAMEVLREESDAGSPAKSRTSKKRRVART